MPKCKCGRWPVYGLPNTKKRIWCSECKPDEAVNVATKKCKCRKSQSTFGLPGQKAQFCKDCKPEDAIDIVHKKCKCEKSRPTFGLPGEKAEFCGDCKPEDAITIHKKCKCGKRQPKFGLPGQKAEFCSDCKPKDAIDVVNKKCKCGKRPNYGLPGQKAEFCNDCKPKDAIDVVNKKCKCGTIPSFGLPGQKAEFCKECKPYDAIDVVSPICPGYDGVPCPVRTQIGTGKSYCLSCDPDESRRLPRKKDEHAFFCFLEKHDIDVTQREYRIDYKCVDTSKSHAFIDGVIITPNIVLCLEVDENAHKHYEPGCDKARTHLVSTELLLAFPEHHIAWIRVNPTISDYDRSDRALKIRDERYFDAVLLIRKLLERPRTDIIYIGYE
ncbi:hypothetical protein NY2A_B310R [Paramecium bursaria Chlorella virus NY2A]|uniref:Uncharacterized protein B310R n=1 Tax=Paramecium bursaria Chlorella virus NY2A TaxID=46021 RepID=A7IWI5_PBCVN|nr:hypothetical protein NY2A_B310R [Paramecium bursaria Chlorella virus NY2A]ABT14709.1 hypothetical protein NY2A_B310R [Paramecium bursaria Chlorella virus NY2A]